MLNISLHAHSPANSYLLWSFAEELSQNAPFIAFIGIRILNEAFGAKLLQLVLYLTIFCPFHFLRKSEKNVPFVAKKPKNSKKVLVVKSPLTFLKKQF